MSTYPTSLRHRAPRHRVRRAAAVAAGLAALGGGTLMASFPVPASAASPSSILKVAHNKTWGNVLELGNGKVVYRFDADPKGKSTCTGMCAKVWPPVVLTGAAKPVGMGVKGLGTIKRSNGQKQVTIKGYPLYTFIGDKKAGQLNGNVKDSFGKWQSVNPAHPLAKAVKKVTSAPPTTAASAGGGSSSAF